MLLNKSLLAQYSPLPKNYDFNEVMQYVDIAEKIWILPIVGYDWYEELCEQVKDNNITPENATALVEAIYPYLGFAVVYESLPFLWVHLSEVGITLGESDNSKSATLKDLTLVQDHLRRQVEVRKDFCKKWICEHYEYYPLADVCACGCSCCNRNPKLNAPNPNQQLYKPYRKCTDLR